MYPVVGRCPVCQNEMTVTHLQCRACATEIIGSFRLSRFAELTPPQVQFLELLVKHRANVGRIAEELGVSYPTARNRLDDLVRALGYEVEDDSGIQERRREVLARLEAGEIGAEEAARLLRG
jgi:hypothetical protein